MQTPWIFSSTFLPYSGEPIDIRLEDRSQPIHETHVDSQFRSRCADYGAECVQSWPVSDSESFRVPIATSQEVAAGRFAAMMERLTRLFSGTPKTAPGELPHVRVPGRVATSPAKSIADAMTRDANRSSP